MVRGMPPGGGARNASAAGVLPQCCLARPLGARDELRGRERGPRPNQFDFDVAAAINTVADHVERLGARMVLGPDRPVGADRACA